MNALANGGSGLEPDPQHRMKNWISFSTVANRRRDKPAQKGKGGGQGRGKGKINSKGGKTSGHDTKEAGQHLFDDFHRKHKNALRQKVHGNPGICWRFQRKQCKVLGIWLSLR